MRRGVGLAGLVAAWLLLTWPAWAHEGSLEEHLVDASEAEFSGQQLVVSWTPAGEVAEVYQVRQGGGMLHIRHEGDQAMMGGGGLWDQGPEGWSRLQMAPPTAWQLSSRYRVVYQEANGSGSGPGRAVEEFEVWDGEALRARFLFDGMTSIPLVTAVFAADGSLYRMSSLSRISLGAPSPAQPASTKGRVVERAEAVTLPRQVAGYGGAGAYGAPQGGVQVFYSDGLFSFSVFEVPGMVGPSAMQGASAIEMAGATYQVGFQPSEVWVIWSRPDYSYILVGDLPLDHLDEVLTELPGPRSSSLLSRFWHTLLGR
ncbi:MAG: hypothetical protein M3N51_08400 [Actinomycetota bacterium]|nr:hypothetical protein [Actinomycetota bacterium]